MNKRLLFLLLFPFILFGQVNLERNAIGLAYVSGYEGTTENHILVNIAFPRIYLRNDSQKLNNKTFKQNTNIKIHSISRNYLLVDTTGIFEFKMEFWCDNDGGTQYRPTIQLKINTRKLLGDYTTDYELQDLLGFAIIDLNRKIEPVVIGDMKPRISLNIYNEIIPKALIWTTLDDAENCTGGPKNNLMIFLKTAKGDFRMRCCGP